MELIQLLVNVLGLGIEVSAPDTSWLDDEPKKFGIFAWVKTLGALFLVFVFDLQIFKLMDKLGFVGTLLSFFLVFIPQVLFVYLKFRQRHKRELIRQITRYHFRVKNSFLEDPEFEETYRKRRAAREAIGKMEQARNDKQKIQSQSFDTTKSVKPTQNDDLKIIEGIGPKIEAALKTAGITTFEQISRMTPDDLSRIVRQEQGIQLINSPETWPQQAKLAASGDIEDLKEYQNQIKWGRLEGDEAFDIK